MHFDTIVTEINGITVLIQVKEHCLLAVMDSGLLEIS